MQDFVEFIRRWPTAADSPGQRGDFYAAPYFLYFCTAPNTWVRSATTPW